MAVFRNVLVLILGLTVLARAQAQSISQAATEMRVDEIMAKLSLAEKIELLGGQQDWNIGGNKRTGIPLMRMSDGPIGVHPYDYSGSTSFPAGIATAATWDPGLAEEVGAALGREARARGVHFLLGPGVNIYRSPLCGRNFEYFGEDPYLASRMAVGYIKGVQGQGVIATVKHFAANNSEFDRSHVDSVVDERTLREIYLPAFEAAVKEAHVGAVMDAYNLINGQYATQNSHLNNDILKGEWGFDGILMSDWGATHDGVAAAKAGLDVEMPSSYGMNAKTLLPALERGDLSPKVLDDKVRRILRTAINFGFFDRPQKDTSISLYDEASRGTALKAARESAVLLKNDRNILPLNRTHIRTIAVIGPNGFPSVAQGGGSSFNRSYRNVSPLEAITASVGAAGKVLYSRGVAEDEVLQMETHASMTTSANNSVHGFHGEYFQNENFKGAPSLIRDDERIAFKWGCAGFGPGGQGKFAVRWSGYYHPQLSGTYYFHTMALGGDTYRVYVDDRLVFEWARRESQAAETLKVSLVANKEAFVRIEYIHEPGGGDSDGFSFTVEPEAEVVPAETKVIATKADAVVVFVGFNPDLEGEGFDRKFELPPSQDELVRTISALNPNTIVVLTGGGNVDTTPWLDAIPALLHTWYAGQEGAQAISEILFGEVNPSGRLPVTFERKWEDNPVHDSYYPNLGDMRVQYKEGIFVGYRGYEHKDIKPLFPFGYGLSYTTFAYKNLEIIPTTPRPNQTVTVSFDVSNTGSRAGDEIAQLYIGNPDAMVPRPAKELKGFRRVPLLPGEIKHVEMVLDARSMSYYDTQQKQWRADPGKFNVLVGHSSQEIKLKSSFTLQ